MSAELRDRDVARFELELLLVAGEVVGAGAVDLERRVARRHLADLAGEARKLGLDPRPGRPRGRSFATTVPSESSVSVSAPKRTVKRYSCALDHERHGLGRLAERDRQHAGGERIERAGMAALAAP